MAAHSRKVGFENPLNSKTIKSVQTHTKRQPGFKKKNTIRTEEQNETKNKKNDRGPKGTSPSHKMARFN